MKVLAILTRFKHHGEHSGYKQILRYIKPTFELGINEDDGSEVGVLKSKYQWLFEWQSFRFRNHVDIVKTSYRHSVHAISKSYRNPFNMFSKLIWVIIQHKPWGTYTSCDVI